MPAFLQVAWKAGDKAANSASLPALLVFQAHVKCLPHFPSPFPYVAPFCLAPGSSYLPLLLEDKRISAYGKRAAVPRFLLSWSLRFMTRPLLYFASNRVANQPVAGVPAAARALRDLQAEGRIKGQCRLVIAVPQGTQLSDWTLNETKRLAPSIELVFADRNILAERDLANGISGVDAIASTRPNAVQTSRLEHRNEATELRQLRVKNKVLLKATGKGQDGLVSRYLNRPISRSITGFLLSIRQVRPIHATALTAFTGIAMVTCLLVGGANGLILGGLLFHGASVIDGVDGEMARATWRSSDFGARLDTITDGVTNIAFFVCATLNLFWQGDANGALFGATGLCLLAVGLTMLGRRSLREGGPFTFDVVKSQFRAESSRIKTALAAITTRDFYAFAFAVAFLFGLARFALLIFAIGVAVWLVTISFVLARKPNKQNLTDS